jgi:hypothetical protein
MKPFFIRKADSSYLFLIIMLFTSKVSAITFPGKGNADDPYRISTVNELEYFRDEVNSLVYNMSPKKLHYKLMNDIILTDDVDWIPIGQSYKFRGYFDGNGHSIRKLKSGTKNNYGTSRIVGLFGFLEQAEVKNLTVEWDTIYSGDCARFGGIAASSKNSNIINCKSNVVLIAKCAGVNAGGIGGELLDCVVQGCESNISMYLNVDLTNYVIYAGGIGGEARGTWIYNSGSNFNILLNSSTSSSTVGQQSYVGGIAGTVFGVVNCYSIGSIFCEQGGPAIGGISVNPRVVRNSYSANNIIVKSRDAEYLAIGGLTPIINSKTDSIDNCIALNDTLIGVMSNLQNIYVNRLGFDYNNNYNSSINNNYANDAMILRRGIDLTSLNSISLSGVVSCDGLPLTDQPVNLLNGFVAGNPMINGVALVHWKVIPELYGGLPVHVDYATSTKPIMGVNLVRPFIIKNMEIRFIDKNVESFRVFDLKGMIVHSGEVRPGESYLIDNKYRLLIINCLFSNGESFSTILSLL